MSATRVLDPAFENDKLARVSSWGNNGSLGCFTHFFAEKLIKRDATLISRFTDNTNPYYEQYQALLRSFEEYYNLEKNSISIETLIEFLKENPNPLDHEAILSPVLRLHLPKTLGDAEESWKDANDVAIDCFNALLNDDELTIAQAMTDYKNILGPNLEAFKKIKEEHHTKDEFLKAVKAFWIETGDAAYKKKLGDVAEEATISDSELRKFARSFGVNVEVRDERSEIDSEDIVGEAKEANEDDFQFQLFRKKNSWQYLADTKEAADTHNAYYLFEQKLELETSKKSAYGIEVLGSDAQRDKKTEIKNNIRRDMLEEIKKNQELKRIQELFGVDAYPRAVKERGLSFIKGVALILENAKLKANELDVYKKELENIEQNWLSIAENGKYSKESILALKKVLNAKIEAWIPEFQAPPALSRDQSLDPVKKYKDIKARKKIKKQLKNALARAENHVNWKKREVLRSIIPGKDENSYLERIDEPIMNLTLTQTKEWESILGPEDKRPAWFTALASWEQEYFRKRVASWDKTKNLGEHLGVPPTTIRAYPGARNSYKSTFNVYKKNSNNQFVIVSTTVKIRTGHVVPLDIKDKEARLRATKENIKQLMLANIQNQIKNGIVEKDGTLDILINLQTLVSPIAPHEDYFMNVIRRQAIEELQSDFKEKRKFIRFLNENNVEIPPDVKPKLSLVASNHAVNIARFFVRKHSENKKTLAEIDKRLAEGKVPKGGDLEKAAKAKVRYDQITGPFFSKVRWGNFAGFGVNHNAERAALKQIMIDSLGGMRIGSCKSGKDREGVVNMHMAAMLLYYTEHDNEFPPIPNKLRPFTEDEKIKRKEYEATVARVFIDGHDTEIANKNSSGARGIKEAATFLGGKVIKAVGSLVAKKVGKDKALEMLGEEEVLGAEELSEKQSDKLGEKVVKTSIKSGDLNKIKKPGFVAKVKGMIDPNKRIDPAKIDAVSKMLVTRNVQDYDYKENRLSVILELLKLSKDQNISWKQKQIAEYIEAYLNGMKEQKLNMEPSAVAELMNELVCTPLQYETKDDDPYLVLGSGLVSNIPTYNRDRFIEILSFIVGESSTIKDKNGKSIDVDKKEAYLFLLPMLEEIEKTFGEFITSKLNNELGDSSVKALIDREMNKDSLLSEKMQLVLLLRKAKGEKVSDELIASYEKKYPGFAEKYKNQKTKADYLKEVEDFELAQGESYKELSEATKRRYESEKEIEEDFLDKFDSSLLSLSAEQVDFVDNLEKFFSKTMSESEDGKPLQHLKVEPGSKVFCKLVKTPDNLYSIIFNPCKDVINNMFFIEKLMKLQVEPFSFNKEGTVATLQCSDSQLKQLMTIFNEKAIMKHKESPAVRGEKTISTMDDFIKEQITMLKTKKAYCFKEKEKKIERGDQRILTQKITKKSVLNLLDMISNLPPDMPIFAKLEIQTRILSVLYDNMLLSGFSKVSEKRKVQESIKGMLKKVRQERQALLITLKDNPEERNNLGFGSYDTIAKQYIKDQIKTDPSEKIENKIMIKAASINTPFKGHSVSGFPATGGKQEKAEFTGFYMDENGKEFMIKMSKNHLADNVAEVVTSSILEDIIGETHSVNYDFIESSNGHMYLKSEKRPDFETLKDRMERTGGKGFFWLGSNPKFDRNKQIINKNIIIAVENTKNYFSMKNKVKRFLNRKLSKKNKAMKRQCAKILAASLLVLDSDCQVENMCFYTKDGKKQMAKFDDGWGLVDICAPGNESVKLFEKIDFHGTRGTHEKAFLPTNHWVDYPYILHSQEFVDELLDVAQRMKKSANRSAEKALHKIEVAYKEKVIPGVDMDNLKINNTDSETIKKKKYSDQISVLKEKASAQVLKLKAYIEFATHIGIYNMDQREEELTKVGIDYAKPLEEFDEAIKALALMENVEAGNAFAREKILNLQKAVGDITEQANVHRILIQKQLSERLSERADSMLLLSKTLNIAIKMDSGVYEKTKSSIIADLKSVYETLQEIHKGKLDEITLDKIFPQFEETPKPFVAQTRIEFLEKVLKSIEKELTKEELEASTTYQYFKKVLIKAKNKEIFSLGEALDAAFRIADPLPEPTSESIADTTASLEIGIADTVPSRSRAATPILSPTIPAVAPPALSTMPSTTPLLEPRPPVFLSSSYTRPTSTKASSNETFALEQTDLDSFNNDGNLKKHATLSYPDKRPKFTGTGQNFVGVLSACEKSGNEKIKALAKLTYTLEIERTVPAALAIEQAKRCLEDPSMGKQITILKVNGQTYTEDALTQFKVENGIKCEKLPTRFTGPATL